MSKVGYVINYAGYGTDVDKEWMKRFGCTEIMEESKSVARYVQNGTNCLDG